MTPELCGLCLEPIEEVKLPLDDPATPYAIGWKHADEAADHPPILFDAGPDLQQRYRDKTLEWKGKR